MRILSVSENHGRTESRSWHAASGLQIDSTRCGKFCESKRARRKRMTAYSRKSGFATVQDSLIWLVYILRSSEKLKARINHTKESYGCKAFSVECGQFFGSQRICENREWSARARALDVGWPSLPTRARLVYSPSSHGVPLSGRFYVMRLA